MSDKPHSLTDSGTEATEDLARFADSYASFNRIINSLQRKYLELKEEFSSQNDQLAETNKELMEMTARNLAASEFLNGILTSLSAGVIAVDREGYITHFNPAASLMLGIPVREPLGKRYREVIPPGQPVEANALRSVETGKAVEAVEKQIELADGSLMVVSTSTAILKDSRGEATGAVEVFHDLTRIKKMEQEIARLNTLAALGEMAAAVAHQVRNPLSGILGYGSLLKRDLDLDDPRQKLVSKITDGVETLNQTVTTLLNYTRHEEVSRERMLFNEFLDNTLLHFRRENADLAERMEFRVMGGGPPECEPAELFVDPVLFRQVLFNLFVNSAEACSTGGTITISYGKLPRQKAARQFAGKLLLGLDETVFELLIADNGPGLSEEVRESVFAPFFTTKEGGVGLGLAVAWKIMKAHGGEIVIDDTFTGGARFRLLLATRIKQVETGGPVPTTDMETRP
jgi:PAS domain S-box-containing protein